MYITEEMRTSVEGNKVAFTYNGKKYEREITSVMDVTFGTWIGDIGFEIEDDFESDSFVIHGNTDKDNIPIMEGLVIQYDSQDGTRHGYIHCETINQNENKVIPTKLDVFNMGDKLSFDVNTPQFLKEACENTKVRK